MPLTWICVHSVPQKSDHDCAYFERQSLWDVGKEGAGQSDDVL